MLEVVGVSAYKIPSGEVTNLPLLERVAATRKPVFLSSGMSNWAELDAAVAALSQGGSLSVLQCTSVYPCPSERVGLNVIAEMRDRWGVPVGFSDHTLGAAAAFAAAALGASAIEKHFTFSRLMYGSDAANSMEPDEFRSFCKGLREVWSMTASPVDKNDLAPYRDMKLIFEKSIVTACPVVAGTILTLEMLAFKKPGNGLGAARYRDVIGRKVVRDLSADHMLQLSDFA